MYYQCNSLVNFDLNYCTCYLCTHWTALICFTDTLEQTGTRLRKMTFLEITLNACCIKRTCTNDRITLKVCRTTAHCSWRTISSCAQQLAQMQAQLAYFAQYARRARDRPAQSGTIVRLLRGRGKGGLLSLMLPLLVWSLVAPVVVFLWLLL